MDKNRFSAVDAGNNPGFYLNLIARLFTRFFDRRLSEFGVNVAYLPVLGALCVSSPRSQGELAQIGQIGQPAMAQMLARMVKEGLLTRTTDVRDGRKIQFSLSPDTVIKMEALRAELSEGNMQVFGVLSDEERKVFMSSLHKIETRLKVLMDASDGD
jgi:DNA-binding MarR family transcriptional regulator